MAKPFLTIDQQAGLLRDRGLVINDEAAAKELLYRVNYYRLSGYARQFQVNPRSGANEFERGSQIERIAELIELDTKLRALLIEALTEIEIGVRSRFAYEAGLRLGPDAFYLEPEKYLDITPDLRSHITKIERELSRPKLRTVERYRNGDDLSGVPIWVAVESITFGALAKLMWYLEDPTATQVTADRLSLQRTGFASAIHSFAVLRNVCAHHGQLWHRSFDVQFATLPKEKRREPKHLPGSAYTGIIVAKRFLRAMGRAEDWGDRVDALLASHEVFRAGILEPAPR